jgi:hypothetical protein
VFLIEGVVFLYAAALASRIGGPATTTAQPRATEIGSTMMQAAE